MNQRGQSTVEAMLTFTVVLLALTLYAYVRHDEFVKLVATIFDYVGSRINLP